MLEIILDNNNNRNNKNNNNSKFRNMINKHHRMNNK